MNQKGFTLIELVAVIVILGVLAAVAIPKFVDMQTEAEVASAKGVYGAAQSAAAINYAAQLVKSTPPTPITTGTSLIAAMEERPDGWAHDDTGGVNNVGICLDVDTTEGDEEDCSASTYWIKITTLGTSGATPVKAVLAKDGSGTW